MPPAPHICVVRPSPGAEPVDGTWTLEGLRDRIAPLTGLRRVRGPALHGLLAAAIARVGAGPFGELATTPSFLGMLEGLLEALSLGNVPAVALAEAGKRLGPGGGRLRALSRLAEASRAELERAGVELPADAWTAGTSVLARGWPEVLAPFEAVDVTVQPPVPPAVVAFVSVLARSASEAGRRMVVRAPLAGDGPLDAALEPLLQTLEAGPELPGFELVPELAETPLARALHALSSEQQRPTDALSAVAAPTARREAAAQVHAVREALEMGARSQRCALAVVKPDDAGELLAALAEAGLPIGRRPDVPLARTLAGQVGLLWARLPSLHLPAELVAWLLGQRLLPRLHALAPAESAALLRRAGVRDAVLGAGVQGDGYAVRLGSLAGRLGERDRRTAAAVEQLRAAVLALQSAVGKAPAQASLAVHLEAWRGGLEAAGFWTALDGEPFDTGAPSRLAAARESAAVETWRAFVRDIRAGWKAAGFRGAEVDRRGFARWLADAAAELPVEGPPGAPGGIDVLPLEALAGRRLDFAGVVGMDAESFPRRAPAALLADDERAAVNGLLGRPALPLWAGAADLRAPVSDTLDRWLLGRVLAGSERVLLSRRRTAGGAPADITQRLLAITGHTERDLAGDVVPRLEEAPSPGWAQVRLGLEATVAPELRTSPVDPVARAALPSLAETAWLADARALGRMEAERLRVGAGLDPPGRYSGGLEDPALAEALALRLGGSREGPLSSTSLSHLANCPFQGVGRKIFGLEPPEDASEELDARGRGQLLHGALELLVRRLLAEGWIDAAPQTLPADLVPGVVQEAARELASVTPTGHPRIWALAQARVQRTLERLLATGKLFPFPGLRPAAVEVPFGRPEAEEGWRSLEIPPAFPGEAPVWIRGTLDRIDRGPGGTGVLDYKSSKRRDHARSDFLVTDFQLPLYLHALRLRGEQPPLRAGWLSLRNLEFIPLEDVDGGPLEGLLAMDAASRVLNGGANLATAVHQLLAEPRRGQFPVRPRDCSFCQLAAVCRISERRAPAGAEG
jgi:RecB family exonuclease